MRRHLIYLIAITTVFGSTPGVAAPQDRPQPQPNIVLMFPDNLGWGEVGAYGSVRGVPTPSIDRLAEEGIRLDNFNVENSCTISRLALLTGRYAIRTGGDHLEGVTLWEVTLAEALQSVGYATGLFGKWHLGGEEWEGHRGPTNQGFDEWYGIPGTSHTAQFSSFEYFDSATMKTPHIWEGRVGEPPRRVKPYDMDTRRTVDREAAERGIEFMERYVSEDRPFFFFYPIDYAGTTGAGDIGDAMADVDHNVNLVLSAIDRLGIEDNTIVFWCTDNGAEERRPWRGSAGPWRGFYNTMLEGGIRTPCVIRWPGRIPAGRVSNEIVHAVDFFPTLAAAVGAPEIVPTDRAIDGVNQLPFLEGRQSYSNRESVIYWTWQGRMDAVKWRDWKFWYRYRPSSVDPNPPETTRLFHLRSDPKEETDVKDFNPWVMSVIDRIVAEFEASTEVYPNVPRGTKDPYLPPEIRR
jgi:arylsulfatase